MIDDDLSKWGFKIWATAIVPAVVGGLVDWYSRHMHRGWSDVSVMEFFGKIFVSGATGLGAFMFCVALGQSLVMGAAISGLSGFMGVVLIKAGSRLLLRLLESRLPPAERTKHTDNSPLI